MSIHKVEGEVFERQWNHYLNPQLFSSQQTHPAADVVSRSHPQYSDRHSGTVWSRRFEVSLRETQGDHERQ